jgi:hypothetical protein
MQIIKLKKNLEENKVKLNTSKRDQDIFLKS